MTGKGQSSKRKANPSDRDTPGPRDVKRVLRSTMSSLEVDWEGFLDVRLFSLPRDGIKVRPYEPEYAMVLADRYVVGLMKHRT